MVGNINNDADISDVDRDVHLLAMLRTKCVGNPCGGSVDDHWRSSAVLCARDHKRDTSSWSCLECGVQVQSGAMLAVWPLLMLPYKGIVAQRVNRELMSKISTGGGKIVLDTVGQSV